MDIQIFAVKKLIGMDSFRLPPPPILPDKGLHPEGGYSNISTSDFLYSEVMIGEERAFYGANYYTDALDNKQQSGNKPDIVFSFLGINDELHRFSEADRFTEAYVKFVQNLLNTYGKDTKIVVLQAVSNGLPDPNEDHNYYRCIRAAGQRLELLFPNNVTFIDRDVISAWGIEISSDKIHPTQSGYDTMTTEIAKLLKSLF